MKKVPFKMKGFSYPGVSPAKKEKLIGPVKPMVDKDKDGIPDFVDSDRGDGSKNTNKDISTTEKKKKNTKKKKKEVNANPKEADGQGIIKIDPTIKPPMGLDR